MNTEQQDLMRSLIEQKRTRDDIKRELISQGFSSRGFEEAYVQMLRDLHSEEPKIAAITASAKLAAMGFQPDAQMGHTRKRHHVTASRIFFIVILVIFLALALFFAVHVTHFSVGTFGRISTVNVGDSALRSKVDVTADSAHYYGNTMGSYDGVCKGVAVVSPVECTAVGKNYSIFAPLSNGQVYCADSAGFKGDIAHAPT